MTEVNIPLLRKAVEWVESEATKPEPSSAWYQPGIVEDAASLGRDCGTCYCVAGFIAMTATGIERPLDATDVALRALGLTDATLNGLFRGTNSVSDIRRIAEDIAGERL